MEKDIVKIEKVDSDFTIKVTVFTPTFNRVHTLERVYRSLQEQTFQEFEWLIVDDGSTDDTASLVAAWQSEYNFFPIVYHWKPNGGKHTAHNSALTMARGEYFAILDSDDWYVPDALKILLNSWETIPQDIRHQFSNVEGLCSYADGRIVGYRYPSDIYDSNHLAIQNTHCFDTRGIYRLDVLRLFPFPEGYDSCFVPESLIWNRMAQEYKTRYINDIVGFIEYQPNGLSKRSIKEGFAKSEPAVIYNRELSAINSFSLVKRLKCKANVYRYSFHNRLSIMQQLREEKSRIFSIPFVILGFLVYLKDKIAVVREELAK